MKQAKPIIEWLTKSKVRLRGADIDIICEKTEGYVRFNRNIKITQLTSIDASALGEVLRGLAV